MRWICAIFKHYTTQPLWNPRAQSQKMFQIPERNVTVVRFSDLFTSRRRWSLSLKSLLYIKVKCFLQISCTAHGDDRDESAQETHPSFILPEGMPWHLPVTWELLREVSDVPHCTNNHVVIYILLKHTAHANLFSEGTLHSFLCFLTHSLLSQAVEAQVELTIYSYIVCTYILLLSSIVVIYTSVTPAEKLFVYIVMNYLNVFNG